MSHGPLFMAFVYLAAAVVGVPIAKRVGLGSVLGYLLAGVAIGPFALGVVGHEGHDVMHFAEFGVVMMLFLVGLELRPSVLWDLRRPILGLGGLQVLVTTGVVTLGAMAFGFNVRPALAVGMTIAMSSTAIVLQSLAEKALLKTPGGQSAFSVLLFQDIAVIPILAIFPLLGAGAEVANHEPARPGWYRVVLVAGAVVAVVVAARFLVRPLFRWLASTRLRETFTAAALLLVVAITLLMQSVGLSPALGTFLAGVVLADSEYRHELESDIEPFKGLLLGVFFISVGAQIDFAFIAARPGTVIGLVALTMALKLGVLHVIGRVFGLDRPSRWLVAFSLAQVGEFAFVLVSFGTQAHVFDDGLAKLLVATVALSMAATPALFVVLERVVLPRVTAGGPIRPHDEITHDGNSVVIAGHGRFGQIVGRMLRANGIGTTVLDLDPNMVDILRRLGIKVHYGDASRPELLETAGCAHAKLFVLAIDDADAALTITHTLRRTYPHLRILARARNRADFYALQTAGAHHVYRETFGSSFEMGTCAFRELGYRAHTAHRLARRWRVHEEAAIAELGKLWGGDEKIYYDAAKKTLAEAERLMRRDDVVERGDGGDGAWNNESLRAAAEARARLAPTDASREEEPP